MPPTTLAPLVAAVPLLERLLLLIVTLPVWVLVCDGVTEIVTHSKIFAPLRESSLSYKGFRVPPADTKPEEKYKLRSWFGVLVQCPKCFGFWVGVLMSLLGLSLTTIAMPSWHFVWRAWMDGAAASAACWTLFVLRHPVAKDLLAFPANLTLGGLLPPEPSRHPDAADVPRRQP